MNNNRYGKLLKNTIIFSVGSSGSKLLNFLIVPLYTFYLSTAEYGRIDLFTTTLSLMLPFTTLLIQESLIRFMFSKEIVAVKAVSNAFVVFIIGSIFTVACYPLYIFVFNFSDYVWLYILVLIISSYNAIYGQFLRANNQAIAFSISGIITTLVLVCGNLFFLIYVKSGMDGYIYSILISQTITAFYITFIGRIFKNICFREIDKSTIKLMLLYSIPLIPNNLMWWIMNAGDKYIINFYLGDGANGIYSLAMKLPTILNIAFTIFMQAWQLSAIEEMDSYDKSEFYDKVFNMITGLLMIGTTFIVMSSKWIFSTIVGTEYLITWKYVPFLCIANLIYCMSTFAGMVYVINKKSIAAFYTTFIGAIANICFNFILIQRLGLFGVAIGTIIGYIFVFAIRYRDAKKDLCMSFSMVKTISALIFILLQSILSLLLSGSIKVIVMIICACVVIFLYRDNILDVVGWIKKRVGKK